MAVATETYSDILKKWGLSKFADIMDEEGWTDPTYWKDLDEDTMKSDLGMKKGHITRFKGEYEKWLEAKSSISRKSKPSKDKKKKNTTPSKPKQTSTRQTAPKQSKRKKKSKKSTNDKSKVTQNETIPKEKPKPIELKDKVISNEVIIIKTNKIRQFKSLQLSDNASIEYPTKGMIQIRCNEDITIGTNCRLTVSSCSDGGGPANNATGSILDKGENCTKYGGPGYGTKGGGQSYYKGNYNQFRRTNVYDECDGGNVYGTPYIKELLYGCGRRAGGVIELICNGTILNNGTIESNGGSESTGGSIFICCKKLVNYGTISAGRGQSSKECGMCGFGRIAIYTDDLIEVKSSSEMEEKQDDAELVKGVFIPDIIENIKYKDGKDGDYWPYIGSYDLGMKTVKYRDFDGDENEKKSLWVSIGAEIEDNILTQNRNDVLLEQKAQQEQEKKIKYEKRKKEMDEWEKRINANSHPHLEVDTGWGQPWIVFDEKKYKTDPKDIKLNIKHTNHKGHPFVLEVMLVYSYWEDRKRYTKWVNYMGLKDNSKCGELLSWSMQYTMNDEGNYVRRVFDVELPNYKEDQTLQRLSVPELWQYKVHDKKLDCIKLRAKYIGQRTQGEYSHYKIWGSELTNLMQAHNYK
eukprot:179689_1